MRNRVHYVCDNDSDTVDWTLGGESVRHAVDDKDAKNDPTINRRPHRRRRGYSQKTSAIIWKKSTAACISAFVRADTWSFLLFWIVVRF